VTEPTRLSDAEIHANIVLWNRVWRIKSVSFIMLGLLLICSPLALTFPLFFTIPDPFRSNLLLPFVFILVIYNIASVAGECDRNSVIPSWQIPREYAGAHTLSGGHEDVFARIRFMPLSGCVYATARKGTTCIHMCSTQEIRFLFGA
jgi:hypothetical protein